MPLDYPEINIRKTFSRLVYFIDQMNQGKSRKNVLKELNFTEEEFQTLLDVMLDFSILRDNDATLTIPNEISEPVYIGGVYITRKNKNIISL
jgi:hypothetical protein